MGQSLTVGLGGKLDPLFQQLHAQVLVILNDPVVDHGQLAAPSHMRVRIGITGRTMGRPASVSNTCAASSK